MPISDELQQRIDFFESRTMLVWIGKNRPHTEPSHVLQALARRFNVNPYNLQVSRHQPEDFLVQFTLREDFDKTAGVDHFTSGGRRFHLRRWTAEHRVERETKRFHIKLYLDAQGSPVVLHLASRLDAWSSRWGRQSSSAHARSTGE